MKKIILSLAIIGVVAGIVTSATIAYFSDTKVVEGNTISTGSVKLGETVGMPFHINNLGPGDSDTADMAIQYEGTLTADLYIGVQTQEGDDLGPVLEYRLERMDGDWEHLAWIVGDADTWHDFAEDEHLMNSWTKTHSNLENGDWARGRLHIRIKTEPLVGDINDYQGKSETIKVILHAVQPEGNAPQTKPRDWIE